MTWLVLEYSTETGGWFLFGHEGPEQPSQFDHWYEDVAIARQQALEEWGIAADAWVELV